jgi:hypothetical protein
MDDFATVQMEIQASIDSQTSMMHVLAYLIPFLAFLVILSLVSLVVPLSLS